MSKIYFARRLVQALHLADQAKNGEERTVHLRASKHYLELLKLPPKSPGGHNSFHSVASRHRHR